MHVVLQLVSSLLLDLERLDTLDWQILELHLMAAMDVLFSTAFLGRIHEECKDVDFHLRKTGRVLSTAVLGLSVLF